MGSKAGKAINNMYNNVIITHGISKEVSSLIPCINQSYLEHKYLMIIIVIHKLAVYKAGNPTDKQ